MRISNRYISVFLAILLLVGFGSVKATQELSFLANLPYSNSLIDSSSQDTGQYVSIAHHPLTGAAFISYYDATNHDLRLAYEVPLGSGNCSQRLDWKCLTVDDEGDVGKYSSIDVDYVQKPFPEVSYTQIGISYFDETNDALKYASGYFQFLISWSIYEVEDSASLFSYGEFSSMKFNSSHLPRIAYHYAVQTAPSFGGVKIANFVDGGSGNCGDGNDWNCTLVDGKSLEPNYGTHISLDLAYNDSVHIAYYDPFEKDLYLAYWTGIVNPTCLASGWYCRLVDGVGDVGRFASIHAVDSSTDKFRLAYYNATQDKVFYAVSTETGYDTFAVDFVGAPPGQLGLSLTTDSGGLPVIAYMDYAGGGSDLKIARPASAYGNVIGNCGDPPPGTVFQYWQCSTIDAGQMFLNAEYADVSVKPDGLVNVAYYLSSFSGQLRVAKQYYPAYLPSILK